jgi:hypothetical protein
MIKAVNRRDEMPPQPDITYSTDEDASEVTFSASTAKGEQWMGGPEKTVPLTEAQAYRAAAEAEDLIVTPFSCCCESKPPPRHASLTDQGGAKRRAGI